MYGAFYHEGSVNILYELMDLGSLRCVINLVKNNIFNKLNETLFEEVVVSYLMKQVSCCSFGFEFLDSYCFVNIV